MFYLYKIEKKKYININVYSESKILLSYFIKHYLNNLSMTNIKYKDIMCVFKYILFRRKKLEPINHIFSRKDFYAYSFIVNKNVLLPREETELLIDLTTYYIKRYSVLLCDLGSGSGIIPIMLKKKKHIWNIAATDISTLSLNTFNLNTIFLNGKVDLYLGSWLSALPKKMLGKLDIIISNPPYINLIEMKKYIHNIKYEPIGALYAKKNGLFNFLDIIHNAKKFLKKNGFLFLEHGYNQGKHVRKILNKNKYIHIRTIKDFNITSYVTLKNRYVLRSKKYEDLRVLEYSDLGEI